MTDTATSTHDEQLLIGGAWREAASGRRFDVTDPATGEVVGSVADADRDDVSAAIDAASAAFPAWAATPAIERGRLLRRAADLMRERSAAIAAVMTAEEGDVLMSDARVRKLSFTGSTEVGKELIRKSADQVMRLSLELGGHAPAIVFDDADLDDAVTQVMASKFRNAGQTCVCANRIYVQRGIHDAFRAAMAERIAALRVGPGTAAGVQIGPLIDDAAVDKVRRHVQDAIERGAELVVGGEPANGDRPPGGHFVTPTLLDGVTADMLLSHEETFGPVAGLTVFDSEDEAIEMANDTPFGLAAYLLTRDYARMLRVAERLEFGIVGANDGAPSVPSAPFGGVKQSGFGREGGDFGID